MTNLETKSARNLDSVAVIIFGAAVLTALALYFVFYAPRIDQGMKSGILPAEEILWLEIHIAVYWVAYTLYFTGFLLAVICFFRKAMTRFPWIETATLFATVLAVIGLITGILFSKPAWNAWWVWDAKHVFTLLNTFILLGISPFIVLRRLFSNKINYGLVLVLLLLIAVAICIESFLVGFMRNIHPQWFPYLLFK